ncbi:MAG: hypothetical protein WC028_01590 [Candidatus Obscuribacterales bacterium]
MKNKSRRLEEGPRDGLTPPPKPMAKNHVAKNHVAKNHVAKNQLANKPMARTPKAIQSTFRLENKEAI